MCKVKAHKIAHDTGMRREGIGREENDTVNFLQIVYFGVSVLFPSTLISLVDATVRYSSTADIPPLLRFAAHGGAGKVPA